MEEKKRVQAEEGTVRKEEIDFINIKLLDN
jgi:hypothetical protein